MQATWGTAGRDHGTGPCRRLRQVSGHEGVAGVLELELRHPLLRRRAAVAEEVGRDVQPVREPPQDRVAGRPLA